MTVAVRPDDFLGGDATLDGEGWQIGKRIYKTNPKRLVTPLLRDFLRTWQVSRSGGMGGSGPLPDPGGWDDQGAVWTDCLPIAEETWAELQPKGRGG